MRGWKRHRAVDLPHAPDGPPFRPLCLTTAQTKDLRERVRRFVKIPPGVLFPGGVPTRGIVHFRTELTLLTAGDVLEP